jgi:hypothetical protein
MKIDNWKAIHVLSGGVVPVRGRGYKEKVSEGEYGGILSTHDVNGKMRSVETILVMGRGGIKENDGGGEFNYDIL